ncbi:glycosyltransferase family 39 protein [Deferribacteraceae bacterium V6Fe1]|nr:glycosyltransferase family 39 protein [Deferribacteraceae bacterium V6Fe1]
MRNKNIYWFIIIYFIIAAFPINNIPLFETTEARYAEIAWEMAASGNYLEPHFNGIKHFHKPPFTYWINAAGIKLFGVSGFGVRIFGVLASAIILFMTYKLANILLKDKVKAENSVYILSASLLFIAVSRIVSTDIYLTLFTILSQYFLFNQIYGKKSSLNAVWYGLFLGFGFITKGPIIFLFTLLPFMLGKVFFKSHRKVFTLKDIAFGILTFLIISLPWYIAVIIKNPELLNYFLKVQTVDRVVTNRFHRNKPFYFFILTFAGTFFPFIIIFVKDLIKHVKPVTEKLAPYFYVIVPFIIFSLAKSKLATYILPFYPIAGIIVANSIDAKIFNTKSFRIPTLIFAGLLPFAFIAAIFVYPVLKGYLLTILIFFILTLLLFINLYKRFNLLNFSVYIIFISFCIYSTLPILGPEIKGFKKMTEEINLLDKDKKYEILTYKTFIPSISFYRQKITVAALGKERETQFQYDDTYKKYYIKNMTELSDFLNAQETFFVVTKPDNIEEISKFGFTCKDYFNQRKYSLYLCAKSNN